jgi:hypothetical protein
MLCSSLFHHLSATLGHLDSLGLRHASRLKSYTVGYKVLFRNSCWIVVRTCEGRGEVICVLTTVCQYTVRSESLCAFRLRYVDLAVSIEARLLTYKLQ